MNHPAVRPAVNMRLLPDGTGRVRICWLVWDEKGPVTMPTGQVMTPQGPVPVGGSLPAPGQAPLTRARIACDPLLSSVLPHSAVVRGQNVTRLVMHSDDPRAVTCPECAATEEYKKAMERYAALEGAPQPG